MKVFFYAGAALMTGASIYGFIDFKRSIHNKEFRNLYKKDKQAVTTKQGSSGEINFLNATVKTDETEKTTEPAISNEKENKKVSKMTVYPVDPAKASTSDQVVITTSPPSIKKRKIVSYKLFSRAALDERYFDKKLNPVKSKKNINSGDSQKH